MTRTRLSSLVRQLSALLAAVVVLCVPALWNQQPILYPDTPTYVRGAEMGLSKFAPAAALKPWSPPQEQAAAGPAETPVAERSPARARALTSVEDKVVLAGRSVYYGVLAYAGYVAGEFWPTIVVQAVAVGLVLHLLMIGLWGLQPATFFATVAALSLLTPLGAYTGFLMPDVFASLAVLCSATLLVYWERLRTGDRWLLAALLAFALSTHASHLAIAVLLLALAILARLLFTRWKRLAVPGLVVLAACCATAFAAEWAFNRAVVAAVGAPPLRLPHPMARLIDMGPGTDYLKRNCPGAGYAACNWVGNYPTGWTDFLFSTDPIRGAFALADPATRRRLSDEQLGFVVAVVRDDPLRVVGGIGADVLRQLTHFGVDIWGYGDTLPALYVGRVPERVLAAMQESRASRTLVHNTWLTQSTYAAVIASLLLWLVGPWRSLGRGSQRAASMPHGFSDFATIVAAGVVLNAVVCATLASSLDRFQSRVVWLLPFLAISALAAWRAAPPRSVPSRAARAASPS